MKADLKEAVRRYFRHRDEARRLRGERSYIRCPKEDEEEVRTSHGGLSFRQPVGRPCWKKGTGRDAEGDWRHPDDAQMCSPQCVRRNRLTVEYRREAARAAQALGVLRRLVQ